MPQDPIDGKSTSVQLIAARQQLISWSNVDLWCLMASPGHSELICFSW